MSDPVSAAIIDLLHRAPERWEALDRAALTSAEERALGLLVAGGLIESRMGLEVSLAGHPQALRLTLEVTGETGLAAALLPALGDAWMRWESAIAAARDRLGGASPVALQPVGGLAWRITDQGVLARQDLVSDDPVTRAYVVRHCRSRWTDGPGGARIPVPLEPEERVPELRDAPLPPITGTARVVERQWVAAGAPATAGPFPVEVQNWAGGAEAIAAALAKLLPSAQPPPAAAASPADRPGSDPARWTGEKKLALLRYLRDHPRAPNRQAIIDGAARAGAGEPNSVARCLPVLVQAGWLEDTETGTCLTLIGIRECTRKVGPAR